MWRGGSDRNRATPTMISRLTLGSLVAQDENVIATSRQRIDFMGLGVTWEGSDLQGDSLILESRKVTFENVQDVVAAIQLDCPNIGHHEPRTFREIATGGDNEEEPVLTGCCTITLEPEGESIALCLGC